MGNRFYIPTESTSDRILPWAKLGLQLHGMKQQGDIRAREQALDARRVGALEKQTEARYGTTPLPGPVQPGQPPLQTRSGYERELAQGESATRLNELKLAEDKRQFDIQEKRLAQAVNLTDKQMDSTAFINIQAGLNSTKKQFGVDLGKSSTPLVNTMKNLTKQGATRYDLFKALVPGKMYDRFKPQILEDVDKVLFEAHANMDEEKITQLSEFRKAVDDGSILQHFFPNSFVRWENEQKVQEADIAAKERTGAGADIVTQGYDAQGKPTVSIIPRNAVRESGGTLKVPGMASRQAPEAESLKTSRGLKTQKDMGDLEALIKKGDANSTDVATFNRFSNQPYLFLQQETPGTLYGTNTETKKVDLPKVNGKQITAKDVAFTAEKHGITVDEVLQQLGLGEE